jgi:hypothetical protein
MSVNKILDTVPVSHITLVPAKEVKPEVEN